MGSAEPVEALIAVSPGLPGIRLKTGPCDRGEAGIQGGARPFGRSPDMLMKIDGFGFTETTALPVRDNGSSAMGG